MTFRERFIGGVVRNESFLILGCVGQLLVVYGVWDT